MKAWVPWFVAVVGLGLIALAFSSREYENRTRRWLRYIGVVLISFSAGGILTAVGD